MLFNNLFVVYVLPEPENPYVKYRTFLVLFISVLMEI